MDQTQSQPTAPNRIFVSYRRQETEYPAGWLFDRLTKHFRGAEVFKDIDSIEPGDDFVEVITAAVESCDVLLALIGDRWLTITDDEGRRRIDDPDDFVRIEIAAALARKVRVVPILVNGAKMPHADDLPDSVVGLVRRQALELSASHFDVDVTRLLNVLDKTIAEVRARPMMTESSGAGIAGPPGEGGIAGPPGEGGIARPPGAGIARPPGAGIARPPGAGIARPPGTGGIAGPPGEDDRGSRAPGRGVPAMVAVAAVVIAIVVGGMGVWLWPRGNAGAGHTGSTTGASHPASASPSPSLTATQPLFVWQTIAGPTAKSYGGAAAVAAYEDEIWVAGGMGRTVRVFDPATKHWANGPELPAGRTHGALVSDGQRLYFIGGLQDPGGVQGLQTVYRLDSPHGTWTEDAPLPHGRFSGAAVWDGSRILFAGGAESVSHRTPASDVWALESGRWVDIATLPNPREHLAATTDGAGTVWFVGGTNVPAGTTGLSAEVDRLRGSSVVPDGSLPNPVQGLSAVWTSASEVCAIGGSTAQPNAGVRPAVATVTCLGGRAWPHLPEATYSAPSATLGDTVYVVAWTKMFVLNFGP